MLWSGCDGVSEEALVIVTPLRQSGGSSEQGLGAALCRVRLVAAGDASYSLLSTCYVWSPM